MLPSEEALNNDSSADDKEQFYNRLKSIVKIVQKNMTIGMEDLDNITYENITARHELEKMDEKDAKFAN